MVHFGKFYGSTSFGDLITTSTYNGVACCLDEKIVEHEATFVDGLGGPQLKITLKWSRETTCVNSPCPEPRSETSDFSDNVKCTKTSNGYHISTKGTWLERRPMSIGCDDPPSGQFIFDAAENPECPEYRKEGEYEIHVTNNGGTKKTKGCSSRYGGHKWGASLYGTGGGAQDRPNGWSGEESVSKTQARSMIADAKARAGEKCPELGKKYYEDKKGEIKDRVKGGGRTSGEGDDYGDFKSGVVCAPVGPYLRNTGQSVPKPDDTQGATLGGLFGIHSPPG